MRNEAREGRKVKMIRASDIVRTVALHQKYEEPLEGSERRSGMLGSFMLVVVWRRSKAEAGRHTGGLFL